MGESLGDFFGWCFGKNGCLKGAQNTKGLVLPLLRLVSLPCGRMCTGGGR